MAVQVIFPLAPGVTHPFSLEGGQAAPTAPTLPDISGFDGEELAIAVVSVASAVSGSNPSPDTSSTVHSIRPDATTGPAAAYGPWSLLSPRQAQGVKRARPAAPQNPAPHKEKQVSVKHPRRPPGHKHGRGAGKGRGLHLVSGEPHFADMHPAWQAIRRTGRQQSKAVHRDLSSVPA
jgi:hypothetical protein